MQSLSWLAFLADPLDFASGMKMQKFRFVLKRKKEQKEASNIL